MKIIRSSGKNPQDILVDDRTYLWASKFKWYVPKTRPHLLPYPYRNQNAGNGRVTIFLHKMIIPHDINVDHRDHNVLNCQESNLRPCTHSQNMMNISSQKQSSSKYLGVSYHKGTKSWIARIRTGGKQVYLGYFKLEDDAAIAYNKAALQYHGEFANPNIISP